MADNGKLEKLLILAYSDSKKAEGGGVKEKNESFEALINPETYSLDYMVKYNNSDQGQDSSGKQQKYNHSKPGELSFELLFDRTGIIDGKPRFLPDGRVDDSVVEDIKKLKEVLVDYKGDAHEPRHVKVVWGELIFIGRAIDLAIVYKLFNPSGKPIRATAKIKFQESIEEEKRTKKQANQSSDLTHIRKIKAGDNLPLLCEQIYGDPKYYLQVAEFNGLGNFRFLAPGTDIVFPPIAKTVNSS